MAVQADEDAVATATFIKVFVVGRSGSGKSTAIRHIKTLAQRRSYDAIHKRDYDILRDMFFQDFEQKRFSPSEYKGFDVTDFSVLDDALITLNADVDELEKNPDNSLHPRFVLIEFARKDYYHALKLFNPDFLKDAYFLFIDSKLDTCIERIHKRRIQDPSEQDSHSVSDFIMKSYFKTENWHDTVQKFSSAGHMLHHFEITNNGSLTTFIANVSNFAEMIFTQSSNHSNYQHQQHKANLDRRNQRISSLQNSVVPASPLMEPMLD